VLGQLPTLRDVLKYSVCILFIPNTNPNDMQTVSLIVNAY